MTVSQLGLACACRPETVNGGTDDPMELGHGRLPAANSNGKLELKEVRARPAAVQSWARG